MNEQNCLKKEIGQWVARHTQILRFDAHTLEVAPTQIDAYGDQIYCFISQQGSNYLVSDDGYLLFKLAPDGGDSDFYQTAKDVAIGAGFIFDEESGTISVITDKKGLAPAILKLAQLQVAISYL